MHGEPQEASREVLVHHERRVTLEEVRAVARGARVRVATETLALLDERRAQVVRRLQRERLPAYGFNRGFGHNVHLAVPPGRLAELQRNLLRSHASGVGPRVDRSIVRAAIFLRLVSLSRGRSGVRGVLVQRLAQLLEADIAPVVPAYGSVGASGDLAPLSHVALALLGEGTVEQGGELLPAAEALERAGIEPLELEMKEGLALNNGMQFTTAIAVLAAGRLRHLLETAAIATALSAQVLLGSDTPFSAELHELRPHPGARVVARWITALMRGSPMREAHRPYLLDGEVQDPYNLRCAAQVLGACHDLLVEAERSFEIEVNSVTDNPVLLRDPVSGAYDQVTSGGHFHGMPVAVKLYNLVQAAAIAARLSNMRVARYVDEARNKGLGPDLKWPGLSPEEAATSSAMMIPEYVSAALTNAIWGAAMPSHLFSLSTDAGQEDHVSMAAPLAVRLWDTLPRLAEVLAVELAFAAQAAAIRREQPGLPSRRGLSPEERERLQPALDRLRAAAREALAGEPADFELEAELRLRYPWSPEQRRLSPLSERVLDRLWELFPPVTRDRVLSDQLQALAREVDEGRIAALVERDVPFTDEP